MDAKANATIEAITEALEDSFSSLVSEEHASEFRRFSEETAALMGLAMGAGRLDLVEVYKLQFRARVESERLLAHDAKWDFVDGVLGGIVSTALRFAPLVL